MNYGLDHSHGPDGRPRFHWFSPGGDRGAPSMTAVEAHVDALRAGHQHGGLAADRLLGADLWASYTYACGVHGARPDPVIGLSRMRDVILAAATALVGRRVAA